MAPEKYRVLIQPRASKDIVAICNFIEPVSPQNAALVARRIVEAIDGLEIFPHRYKIHRWNRRRDRIVRSMPVPPFIVYFRIRERVFAVDVITVRHGSQQPPRRF